MTTASAAPALNPLGLLPAPMTGHRMDRRLFIVIAVVGLHVLGLWALQAGLLRRAVELVVPVQVLAEFIEAAPPPVSPSPAPPQPPQQRPTTTTTAAPLPRPVPQLAPQPTAVEAPTTESQPLAPTAVNEPPAQSTQPTATVATTEPPAATAPPAANALLQNEPARNADHLNNPKPPYPTLSHRLNETGVVQLRVRVEADGYPSEVQLYKTSGYPRLDQAAIAGVKSRWRFVPAKQNGVSTASWIIQSVRFNIQP